MDDLRAISSNEFPTDVSARTTNSRLSWLIVSCQQYSIILFGYIGNKLERKKKKERGGGGEGRGGEALRILKNQREGGRDLALWEGKCIATNYKGRTQLPRQRNFQRVPTKYVRS